MAQPSYQRRLIEKHNREMEIIRNTSQTTGLSQAILYYAAALGIYGIPWNTSTTNPSNKQP